MTKRAKKIMVICGSPRKEGNTNTIVKWFAAAATDLGADVEIVDAASIDYKVNGCTECMACQESDKYECAIDDDASAVIARMLQFDVLVLATPVFWFGPSAQLKLLLDRTFALVKFDPDTGEPIQNSDRTGAMCLIATAAGGLDTGLELLDNTFKSAAAMTGDRYDSLLVPFAPQDHTKMAERDDIKAQAIDFAQRVASC